MSIFTEKWPIKCYKLRCSSCDYRAEIQFEGTAQAAAEMKVSIKSWNGFASIAVERRKDANFRVRYGDGKMSFDFVLEALMQRWLTKDGAASIIYAIGKQTAYNLMVK